MTKVEGGQKSQKIIIYERPLVWIYMGLDSEKNFWGPVTKVTEYTVSVQRTQKITEPRKKFLFFIDTWIMVWFFI